jgi:hypothetical protein
MTVQEDINQLRDLVTEAIAIFAKDEDVPTKPEGKGGKGKTVDLAEFTKRQEADIKAQRDFMNKKVPVMVGLFFTIFGSAFVSLDRIANTSKASGPKVQTSEHPQRPNPKRHANAQRCSSKSGLST